MPKGGIHAGPLHTHHGGSSRQSGSYNLFARSWRPTFTRQGDPTIVLFHDSLGCVALWRDFPDRLATATGLPVVAYDRLGFGRSDANPEQLTCAFITDEARTGFVAIRKALGLNCFIAFGHSAGGGMAIATGAAFPEACAAVITLPAQAFAEEHTLTGIRAARVQFAVPDQFARLARYHGDKTQWVLDAWIETWLSPNFAAWTLNWKNCAVRFWSSMAIAMSMGQACILNGL